MASAKRNQLPALPPPVEIVLTLTAHEADVLRSVVGSISGNGKSREATGAIWRALVNAGAQWDEAADLIPGEYGNIVFREDQ